MIKPKVKCFIYNVINLVKMVIIIGVTLLIAFQSMYFLNQLHLPNNEMLLEGVLGVFLGIGITLMIKLAPIKELKEFQPQEN